MTDGKCEVVTGDIELHETSMGRWGLFWRLAAGIAMLAGVAAVAWIWRLGFARFGSDATWLLVQAPLSICAGALAWRFASSHERRWIMPTQQLARLIEEIQKGEAPIESLSGVRGPIAPLAQSVRELSIELRRQKQANARLHAETRKLVEGRTSALERRINTFQSQAKRDVLTGLHNRRSLEEQVPKLIEQCNMTNAPLCVLAVDMDNFKTVNDTLGHAAGDRLLRDVGQLIRSAVRDGDWAFRVGGDEFVIVLPGHDWPAGKNLARRLVAVVDQLAATLRTEPRAGISIGIACPDDLRGYTPESLMHEADRAMYQEKGARKALALRSRSAMPTSVAV
jgi:diguanylate cyclase (GGDEF)-like protein